MYRVSVYFVCLFFQSLCNAAAASPSDIVPRKFVPKKADIRSIIKSETTYVESGVSVRCESYTAVFNYYPGVYATLVASKKRISGGRSRAAGCFMNIPTYHSGCEKPHNQLIRASKKFFSLLKGMYEEGVLKATFGYCSKGDNPTQSE